MPTFAELVAERRDHRHGVDHRIDGDLGLLDAGEDFALLERHAELLVHLEQRRIDVGEALRPARSSWAPRSSTCPGSRSWDSAPAPSSARSSSASGDRPRGATRASTAGSFFLAEMKRTVSSLSPFGAMSLSMSVSKPYLYLSTSSASTFATVSCSISSLSVGISNAAIVSAPIRGLRPPRPWRARCRPRTCSNPSRNAVTSASVEFQPRLTRRAHSRELRRHAHRREHMARPDLARRAGRPRRHRNPHEVEPHHRHRVREPGHREVDDIADPLRRLRRTPRRRRRQSRKCPPPASARAR